MTSPTGTAVEQARPERVESFDTLRAWAIAGVVLLHSAATALIGRLDQPWPWWSTSNLINLYDALGRFGVGCFFMVSGALLLDPDRSFHLGRRLRRVVVPVLAWTVVYVATDVVLDATGRNVVIGSVSSKDLGQPLRIVGDVLSGPAAYHLWFCYALVGIYLVVPLLRPLTALEEPRRKQLLLYAAGLWAVASVGLSTYAAARGGGHGVSALLLPSLPSGLLGVFLLGFVLTHYRPTWPPVVFAGIAIAGLAAVVLTIRNEVASGGRSLWGYDNGLLPVVVFVTGVFLLVTSRKRGAGPVARLLSRLSFRVYLVHVLVLQASISVGPTAWLYSAHPAIGVPVVALVTLVGSAAIAWVLERAWGLRVVL